MAHYFDVILFAICAAVMLSVAWDFGGTCLRISRLVRANVAIRRREHRTRHASRIELLREVVK